MDTIVLIISLVVGILGILVIILGYQKDRTSKQHASKILAKRIFMLTLVIAIFNSIVPAINNFKTKPPTTVTRQEVEQIFENYMGEKPANPPIEEVKSEIEKELKAAFEKQEKRALDFYQKGNKAYDDNQFKEAIILFKKALEIVKIPSLYLSLGNSYLVTGDFRSAMKTHQISLSMYRNSKDKKGEGNSLGNLGIACKSLGQYEKAIEYYNQALAISREIGDRQGEGSHLGNLGNTYKSLGQYEKARQCFNQSLAIFDEIKSPYSQHIRKLLDLLETADTK